MLKQFSATLRGVSPHIQHNCRLADPRCIFVREMKKVTSLPPKVKNTDENLIRLSKLEWAGGLYHTGDVRVVDSEPVAVFDDDARVRFVGAEPHFRDVGRER